MACGARSGLKHGVLYRLRYGDTPPLSPTLFRNAGKSATVDGDDVRVNTAAKHHHSLHAHYRVSRADPGARALYRDDHGDHSASAAHYGRRRLPDASTTRTPETTPVTGAPGGRV